MKNNYESWTQSMLILPQITSDSFMDVYFLQRPPQNLHFATVFASNSLVLKKAQLCIPSFLQVIIRKAGQVGSRPVPGSLQS